MRAIARAEKARCERTTSQVVRKPTQGSLEADAPDYFGDYAINPDRSVLLKSDAIPYRIEAYKVLVGPNPTGHAVWCYLDYGDWGITTFSFAPGAGG